MSFSEWHLKEYGETLTEAFAFFTSTVGKNKACIIMSIREQKYGEEN
ncbi:hypothetical protein B4086_5651 [Bacillus cereus]|nr:hypothetical protein B4086_5651 [Bacillus cereus]